MGRELGAPHAWRAFDVDDTGRVLAGWDGSADSRWGGTQLVELDATGPRQLTALPQGCAGRYLPGERAVVVSHGMAERRRLSVLPLDPAPEQPVHQEALTPLVHEHAELTDVLAGRVVYRTNRRNGVDFDVLIKNVFSGEEETVYDAGGPVAEARVGPHSRYVAVGIPRHIPNSDDVYLVDTMPETEDTRLVEVTAADPPARHEKLGWLAEEVLLLSTNRGRQHTGLATFAVSSRKWRWLVVDEQYDVFGWPSPDGTLILVESRVDGSSRLSVHSAADGTRMHQLSTPAASRIESPEPVWSANSRFVAFTLAGPDAPGDVVLVDLHTEQLHQLTGSAAQG